MASFLQFSAWFQELIHRAASAAPSDGCPPVLLIPRLVPRNTTPTTSFDVAVPCFRSHVFAMHQPSVFVVCAGMSCSGSGIDKHRGQLVLAPSLRHLALTLGGNMRVLATKYRIPSWKSKLQLRTIVSFKSRSMTKFVVYFSG
ncbi:hypothetical protein BS17DRAFT_780291 [Gyrodon lividus]|nr:hypothetical protein BS17DRAFT_780291 [Gyrodon lividus]